MPRRPLPTIALVIGLAAVLFAFTRPALGLDPTPNPGPNPKDDAGQADAGPNVRVELTDGAPAVEGHLQAGAITLRTETGSRTILMSHVRRVTFQKQPDGHGQDTVQLTDGSTVRGEITADTFIVSSGDTRYTLRKVAIREIKVVQEQNLSWSSIALGLLTLTAMEIVLGIDNIIFLAIVAGRLPQHQQPSARRIGLVAALGTRLLLLFSLTFLLGLTRPLFTLPNLPLLHDLEAREVSWRDIILLVGGLFLIGKSVFEMHEKLEHAKATAAGTPPPARAVTSFVRVIVTIAVIDIVFSLDSVITAVGMVEQLWVMITAMVIAMLVMVVFSGPISRFVERHPTIKVLALAFLILIGVMLLAEGLGQHMDKGYIYFAMAFAVVIEMVNMRLRRGTGQGHKGEPTPSHG